MQPQWQGLGKVQFSKWQGLGNNYIVLHVDQLPFELTPDRVRLLCDRNVGIGSDGILLIGEQTGEARFGLRIFNPDGSEAEMCGNGVRMVARKLKMEGLIEGDTVVLDTPAGEIVPKLGEGFEVTVDMGIARFGGEKLDRIRRRRRGAEPPHGRPQLHVHVRRRRQPARHHPVAVAARARAAARGRAR